MKKQKLPFITVGDLITLLQKHPKGHYVDFYDNTNDKMFELTSTEDRRVVGPPAHDPMCKFVQINLQEEK